MSYPVTNRQTNGAENNIPARGGGGKVTKKTKLEMWANAQRDGRPAEHRWRPLFNAAKFG